MPGTRCSEPSRAIRRESSGVSAPRTEGLQHPLRCDAEQAAERDEVRSSASAELVHLGDRAGLCELADPRRRPRATPRNSRSRPSRTSVMIGDRNWRMIAAALRYAREAYGVDSARSRSAAKASSSAATLALSRTAGTAGQCDNPARGRASLTSETTQSAAVVLQLPLSVISSTVGTPFATLGGYRDGVTRTGAGACIREMCPRPVGSSSTRKVRRRRGQHDLLPAPHAPDGGAEGSQRRPTTSSSRSRRVGTSRTSSVSASSRRDFVDFVSESHLSRRPGSSARCCGSSPRTSTR